MTLIRIAAMVGVVSLLWACSDAPTSTADNSGGADVQASADAGGSASGDVDTAVPAEHPGKKTYTTFCFSCHAVGLSGAPKLGDKESWAPRIAKGADFLLQTTIEGIPPAMPVRGLCMDCSDEELALAIDYMIQESR